MLLRALSGSPQAICALLNLLSDPPPSIAMILILSCCRQKITTFLQLKWIYAWNPFIHLRLSWPHNRVQSLIFSVIILNCIQFVFLQISYNRFKWGYLSGSCIRAAVYVMFPSSRISIHFFFLENRGPISNDLNSNLCICTRYQAPGSEFSPRSTKPSISPRPTLKTAKKEAFYEHSCYASSLVSSPCSRKHQATQRAINIDVFHWFSRVWIKNGGSLEREGGCRAAESVLCGRPSPAKVQHFTAYNAVSLHIHRLLLQELF